MPGYRWALLALLMLTYCGCVVQCAEQAPESSESKMKAYQAAVNTVADNINKASEKSEALIAKHMSAVDKDPGALITKEMMQKMVQANSLQPQKAGTRSITVESQQGFNGITNYQPSGWKITETMSGPTQKDSEPASEKQPVVTYPVGVGPVLMNGCTATEYTKTSPCYNSKLFDLQNTVCTKMMDAANYIGVGFDGRGYYRAESRKASLIQRSCANRATFMGQDVPDTMNVFGIFETIAETKSFQSADEYMSYIRNKAGLAEQKNLFNSEASKFSQASSFGFNLGGILSMVGAGIGAFVGGPVGAGMGATLGGAVGGSMNMGTGSGSGSSSSTDKGQSSSNFQMTDQSSNQQSATQNFFAIMYVNVVLYDISLDEVKPTDINLAALKDFMSLPQSYFSAGADVKYQNFLLRWGTHFIRSAKFGGQLKVTKTAKTDKIQSQQQFASIAETEFQSMFATLQSKYSQQSSSWGFLGFGGESKETSQSSSAKSEASQSSSVNAQNKQSQGFRQSEFTQTTVEAQGGTPAIAEALVDFYTPAFKQLFHDWIMSIKDFPKPFEFQLRPINELFNLNIDSMFPAGNKDFGCVGDGSINDIQILVDPKTSKRYYIEKRAAIYNNVTVNLQVRVDCKYKDMDDFKLAVEKRMMALEKAVAVYMVEGPFPTSSFEVPEGQAGCEEETLKDFSLFGNTSTPLKFVELLSQPFLIAFSLPEAVPGIVTPEAKYMMVNRLNRWFALQPNEEVMHLYEGCQVANLKSTDTKVCFRNIILTYDESTGLFSIDRADFDASKQRIPTLPFWLAGSTVARATKMPQFSSDPSGAKTMRVAIPCNVKWLNSRRLDPNKDTNCIHFTAASAGDLFVIFSAIPKLHTTWYYLQISPEGVSFYHAMKLEKIDQKIGIGMLGDKNLYQSFFVCVVQTNLNVTIQYGKSDPDSEVGTVYSAYMFPPDNTLAVSRLSFYSFGAGTKSASLMDVRQTKKMPDVSCMGDDYVKKNGRCELACHAECDGCKQARDSKSCQQCKTLRVVTTTGEVKVTDCVAQCPPGFWLSDVKGNLCAPCAAGTAKEAAGNQACTPCSIGSFSAEGAARCGSCPAGTYTDGSASQQCKKCPAGKYSSAGASSCADCPVGKYSDEAQPECSLCPMGRYSKSVGSAQCEQCEVGFFASTRGLTECARCPAGSTSTIRGASSCANNCELGEFSPSVGVACTKCPAGSYAESKGSISCTVCPAGAYQPAAGQSSCISGPLTCGVFQFVNKTGATACTDCENGAVAIADRTGCHRKLRLQACIASQHWSADYPCGKAMDNDRNYNNSATKDSVFVTSKVAGEKYWQATLEGGNAYNITKVVIWRRIGCCPDQVIGAKVYVIRSSTAPVNPGASFLCGTVTSADKQYTIFDCAYDWITAVKVTLVTTESNSLSLAEVEVYV